MRSALPHWPRGHRVICVIPRVPTGAHNVIRLQANAIRVVIQSELARSYMNTDITIALPPREPLKVRIAPLVVLLISLAAVVVLPQIAHGQSGSEARFPRVLTLSLVAVVVWSSSLIILYLTWRSRALHVGWLISMAACFLMLVTVKFVLSPAEYFAKGASVSRVAATAGGVLVFYLITLLLLAVGVKKTARVGLVPLPWKILLIAIVGTLIFAASSAAASLVGSSAGQYLTNLFSTSFGLLLMIALLLTAILFVQALEYGAKPVADGSGRAALAATAGITAMLLLSYHVLWVILVVRLQ